LGSISQTFYAKLLLAQIPEAQKKTDDMIVFFALLGSAYVKAASKMLMKLTFGLSVKIYLVNSFKQSNSPLTQVVKTLHRND